MAPQSGSAPERPLSVVGIGASAGGLEPLEQLLSRLKPSRLAYVVLQHLAPTYDSPLRELLARKTSLKVVTAANGDEVQPDVIYVAPPGAEVALSKRTLQLSPLSPNVPRTSIDTFFRSLAQELGSDAIGVVLSGAGADGSLGLRAIRAEGGVTFVQQPVTASQPSMPQSALDAVEIDFCLPPAEIGEELVRLGAHPYVARKRVEPVFEAAALAKVFDRLRRSHGVDFSTYKLSTIERRLERRLAVQKADSIEQYLGLLDARPGELDALYADLLIGVTAFFRDGEPFEAIKTLVLPRILEHRVPGAPIRIWVPGCASGEEAFSIGICLLEYLGTHDSRVKAQIFATDIDDEALARARAGVYSSGIALDLSTERLQRFFTKHDKGYQVCRQVRDLVVFARHNLGMDPPYSRLDLISCRNVLIYMQPALQKKVLKAFHYSLNPDGFLLLGNSESVGDADYFSLIDRRLKIFLKKDVSARPVFDFSAPVEARPAAEAAFIEPRDPRAWVTVQQLADRKVVEKYGPPGVVIDESLEVLQFRGQTGPFLSPTPGTATLSVLKLVRPELLLALRSVVHRALEDDLPHSSPPLELHTEHGGPMTLVLDVMPLHETGRQKRGLLVLFRQTDQRVPSEPPVELPTESRIQELERELLTTKECLQTSVADLASANEELQSSNEELQSSNEELQSSNEELETSKEELQSTNEELSTVNEELHNRMRQLSQASEDLQNVLGNSTSAVVLVDAEQKIRRYSALAERLLHLIPGDVGRPVGYLDGMLKANVAALVSLVIAENRSRELRVQCGDGFWYTLKALPYLTSDNAIRGAILDFTRAKLPRPLDQHIEVNEVVGKVLSTLPHILALLDDHLRLVWVNRAFFDRFVVGAEVLSQPLEEVWAAGAAGGGRGGPAL